MNPDFALAGALFLLLATLNWRAAACMLAAALLTLSVHSQLGYF